MWFETNDFAAVARAAVMRVEIPQAPAPQPALAIAEGLGALGLKNPAPCDGGHTTRNRRSDILPPIEMCRSLPVGLGEVAMLNLLTFIIVAVALGIPLVLPLLWGRVEKA